MEQKRCFKCTLIKPINEFYRRKSGKRAGQLYEHCKSCSKKRGRDYYYKTREHQLGLVKLRVRKYVQERLEFLAKAKNKPCAECKSCYPPWVMDFDHLDSSTKLGDISHMFLRRMWNIKRVEEEISKCEVVCANCHRKRTYGRGRRSYDSVINIVRESGYVFSWEELSKPS